MEQRVHSHTLTVSPRDAVTFRTRGTCWILPASNADRASASNVYGVRFGDRAVFLNSARGVIVPGNTCIEILNAFADREQRLTCFEVQRP